MLLLLPTTCHAHLVEGVLDADDGVVLAELLVDCRELIGGDGLALVLSLALRLEVEVVPGGREG